VTNLAPSYVSKPQPHWVFLRSAVGIFETDWIKSRMAAASAFVGGGFAVATEYIKADDCVGTPQGRHEISVMSRFGVAPRGRLLGCISVRTAPCERLARNRRDGRETIVKAARMAEMISGDLRRSHLHVRKPAARPNPARG
jgi:hypothetical protein